MAEASRKRDMELSKGAFGRLLKFWRESKSLSQQELALQTGGSMRHISFLENDRARPGRDLVEKISDVLGLHERDRNALLLAAGYYPVVSSRVHYSQLRPSTQAALVLSMKSQDPYAASVQDRYGNIVMVNKAWVATYLPIFGDQIYRDPLNTHRLFLEKEGWRKRLVGWEDLACSFLFSLKCEVLTYPDPEAEALLQELLSNPWVPKDWAKRGAKMKRPVSGVLHRELRDGTVRSIFNVNVAFGMASFYDEPRLILSYLYPQDENREAAMAKLDAMDLEHPLLPY